MPHKHISIMNDIASSAQCRSSAEKATVAGRRGRERERVKYKRLDKLIVGKNDLDNNYTPIHPDSAK